MPGNAVKKRLKASKYQFVCTAPGCDFGSYGGRKAKTHLELKPDHADHLLFNDKYVPLAKRCTS